MIAIIIIIIIITITSDHLLGPPQTTCCVSCWFGKKPLGQSNWDPAQDIFTAFVLLSLCRILPFLVPRLTQGTHKNPGERGLWKTKAWTEALELWKFRCLEVLQRASNCFFLALSTPGYLLGLLEKGIWIPPWYHRCWILGLSGEELGRHWRAVIAWFLSGSATCHQLNAKEHGQMAMDQYLYIPFLVGWTSINPSYFDVNYRGTIGFDTLPNHSSSTARWCPRRQKSSACSTSFPSPASSFLPCRPDQWPEIGSFLK